MAVGSAFWSFVVVALVAGVAAAMSAWCLVMALDRAIGFEARSRSARARTTQVPAWARRRLEAADIPDIDGAWRRARLTLALAFVLGLAMSGLAGLLAAAMLCGSALLLLSALTGERLVRRVEAELPAALESVARALRGGASVHGALARCGEDGSGVGRDLARLATAPTMADGLAGWVGQNPIKPVELAAAALAVGTTTGSGLARSLDQFSLGLRLRSDTQAEARALSTQARASAGLLAIAPFVFLAVMAVTDPRIITFLVGSTAGWMCLAAALVLDVGAAVAMIAMTRIDR